MLNVFNYLIHQNKSRICDNVNHAYFKNNLPTIDKKINQLLDSFITSIKKSDLDSSLKYAAHIFKIKKEYDIINALSNPRDENTNILINLFKKYNSLNRNRTDVLFLVHLILYRTMDINSINIVQVDELTMDNVDQIFKDNTPLKFGDYVFDKHTKQGIKLGRGFKHFYEEGAYLNQCFLDDPYEKIAKNNNINYDSTSHKKFNLNMI